MADSAYGTYVDLALVRSANADAVFRFPSCPERVIFAQARSWALAIIKSCGNVSSAVLNP